MKTLLLVYVLCGSLLGTYGQWDVERGTAANKVQSPRNARTQREGVECDLPLARGSCNQNITRYYYDQARGKCRKFTYTGCDGNLNNFQHLDECNFRCVCSRPRDFGSGSSQTTRYFYNVEKKECQRFTYKGSSGNTNNFLNVDSCKSTCDPIRNRCKDRPNYGRSCNSGVDETRFYYDINCDCCRSFVYLGCGGNHNKFVSKETCIKKCSISESTPKPPTRPDLCYYQPVYGACMGQLQRYYWDYATETCKRFLYSGCGGNANNFLKLSQCRKTCLAEPNKTTPKPTTTTTEPTTTPPLPAFCSLRPARGPCLFRLTRFYYDTRDGVCKQFVWSGCGGNENRFNSVSQCQRKCLRG